MLKFCSVAISLCAILLPACSGKEAVYLTTGFSLEVDSHTQQDRNFVFRIGTGTLELPGEQVLRIETIPATQLPGTAGASPITIQNPEDILNEAAYNQGLDENFVRSVAKVESGLRQSAISGKGAIGLMQLMPTTAVALGVRADQAPDNAKGGAEYLRDLLIRYRGNSVLALAAYNAGPEAVARFRGVPPYPETVRYVSLVLREYSRQKTRLKTTSVERAPNTPSATN